MPLSKGKIELLDQPVEHVDQLALVNEVLVKRQEELEQIKLEHMRVENEIKSAKEQWAQQRKDHEYQVALRKKQTEDQLLAQTAELNASIRAQQDALMRIQNHETAIRHEHLRLQQERAQLRNLTQERIEIEQLRRALKLRQDDVEARWSQNQAALSEANEKYHAIRKLQEEVERRTAELNALSDDLSRRTDELRIREHQLEIVQQALEQKLPEQQESSPSPAVVSLEESLPPPSTQEAIGKSPEQMTERHKEFLPHEDTMPQAMPSGAPAPSAVSGLIQTTQGHPVLDGTKEIDNRTWKPRPKEA